MKKIIIDARLYGLKHRGLGRYLVELINGLIKLEAHYHYILLIDNRTDAHLPPLPANMSTVAAPYPIYSWSEQRFLPGLIKSIKPALVHWIHFNAPYFCPAPFIITIHDLILHQFPNERATTLPPAIYWTKILAYRLLMRRLVNKAQKIITVSRSVAEQVKHYYPHSKSKITVVPLGPSHLPTVKTAKPLVRPYLLMVGAAYPHKNLERVIAAVASLRKRWPELELRLVGRKDFFYSRLEKLVKDLGYDRWVIFMGELSDSDLAGWYQHCQAYLLLSLQEGFGLGALEAAAMGAPVIAADIPVLHEVMSEAALYVEPTNIEAIAQTIELVLTDNKLREKLISNASLVLKRYDWSLTAAQTLAVYQQVIEQ